MAPRRRGRPPPERHRRVRLAEGTPGGRAARETSPGRPGTNPGVMRRLRREHAAPAAAGSPRWYVHPYNRGEFYRVVTALGGLPRGWRLALAQRIGPLAARFMPSERAVVQKTLAVVTGASGRRLEALTARLFA